MNHSSIIHAHLVQDIDIDLQKGIFVQPPTNSNDVVNNNDHQYPHGEGEGSEEGAEVGVQHGEIGLLWGVEELGFGWEEEKFVLV